MQESEERLRRRQFAEESEESSELQMTEKKTHNRNLNLMRDQEIGREEARGSESHSKTSRKEGRTFGTCVSDNTGLRRRELHVH